MLENIVWLMLVRDGKIFLLESMWHGKKEFCLVGGHIKKNESLKEAIIRETYEEIGIKIKQEDLVFKTLIDRKLETGEHKIHFFFHIDKFEGEPYNREPHKHLSSSWINLNNLPKNIGAIARIIIESLDNNQPFFEYGP